MAYIEMVHQGVVYQGCNTNDTKELLAGDIKRIILCNNVQSMIELDLDDGSALMTSLAVAKESIFIIKEDSEND